MHNGRGHRGNGRAPEGQGLGQGPAPGGNRQVGTARSRPAAAYLARRWLQLPFPEEVQEARPHLLRHHLTTQSGSTRDGPAPSVHDLRNARSARRFVGWCGSCHGPWHNDGTSGGEGGAVWRSRVCGGAKPCPHFVWVRGCSDGSPQAIHSVRCQSRGMHWKGGGSPLKGCAAYAQPLSPCRQVPASMAFVTDSNRPQPLWQPPPTACLTASGAPSLGMHPCQSPLPAGPPGRISQGFSLGRGKRCAGGGGAGGIAAPLPPPPPFRAQKPGSPKGSA